jgi:hypothetical protein
MTTVTAEPALPFAPRQTLLAVASVLLFLVVLAAVSWRLSKNLLVPGRASLAEWGLASFRDAIYYPMIAVGDGVNPYDSVRDDDPTRYMNRYPVGSHFPLYSPLLLAVHAPFALLPLNWSMLAYCGLNVGLLLVLAFASIRIAGHHPTVAGVFGLGALLLASQPGRANFNAGQPAIFLALSACAALGASCPGRSALGLCLLTCKPTVGGPIGLLMAARGQFKAAVLGLGLGGLCALVGGMVIFGRSGDLSLAGVQPIIQGNHAHFLGDPEHHLPETSRLDLLPMIERLLGLDFPGWLAVIGALAVLGASAAALGRASDRTAEPSAGSVSSAVMMLAMFLCVFHLVYDALLLVVPAVAAAVGTHPSWRQVSRGQRWVLGGLLTVPFVNVLWTDRFRAAIAEMGFDLGPDAGGLGSLAFNLATSGNAIALTAAWAMLLCLVMRSSAAPRVQPT